MVLSYLYTQRGNEQLSPGDLSKEKERMVMNDVLAALAAHHFEVSRVTHIVSQKKLGRNTLPDFNIFLMF